MYYESVNRGVIFTKTGKYSVGLVILLGLIATGSGYNAFYLSLSLGLALLVVSGILSENVIKACEVRDLSEIVGEAGQPFSAVLTLENSSPRFSLYGVENQFFLEFPRRRWRKKPFPPFLTATLLTLPPAARESVTATGSALPRGLFSTLYVRTQTVHPFGWIQKFKWAKVSAKIMIVPVVDLSFATSFRIELRRRSSFRRGNNEFQNHIPYTTRDSIRHVDWKKSAGREERFWVIKKYETESSEGGILIELDQAALRSLPNEELYEAYLSRVRTALSVVEESSRPVVLRLGGQIFAGHMSMLEVLSRLPRFTQREMPFALPATLPEPPKSFVRVVVLPDRVVWPSGSANSVSLRAG